MADVKPSRACRQSEGEVLESEVNGRPPAADPLRGGGIGVACLAAAARSGTDTARTVW